MEGYREMKAELGVQLSVYWSATYCESTNDELLVGVLLSGSKFICSVGILGATFSFQSRGMWQKQSRDTERLGNFDLNELSLSLLYTGLILVP